MTEPPIIKSMTRRYVAVLCVLAGLLVAGYYTFRALIDNQKTAAATINLSDRQRMLSLRVAMSTYLYTHGGAAEKKQQRKSLTSSISMMERLHKGLTGGDEKMKLSGNLSPEIRAVYFSPPYELDRRMHSFLADAKSIAATAGTIGPDDPRVRRILAAAWGPLLEAMDAALRRYLLESEQRMERLDLVADGVLVLSLLVLVLSAFGVFRPLARRVGEEMENMVKAETRTRTIIEHSLDCIIAMNDEGGIIEFNPSAEQTFGYTRSEAIGKSLAELLIPPRLRDRHRRGLENYIATGEGSIVDKRVELEAMRADGAEFPVELAVSVSGIGKQRIFTGFLRDITDRRIDEEQLELYQNELERKVVERTHNLSGEIARRRRMETALRESQQRLQAITGSLFEGVLVVDVNGHIVFANRSACSLLGGRDDGKLAGLDVDDVFLLKREGDDVHFTDSPFHRAVESGKTIRDDDAVFVTNDGDVLYVAFACSPLIENGMSRGTTISFRDISARKEAQNEALQASKLASVGQLAAGIAHEINTPTQYIGDNLRFLDEAHRDIAVVLDTYRKLALAASKAGVLGERVAEVAAAVEVADLEYLLAEIPAATDQSIDGVERVARIVLAMKEFSHPGSKDKTATDLNRAIENTLMVCRNEWKHVADVDTDLDPALPPVICLPDELNQVFLNLIVNAAHAIGEAGGEAGEGGGANGKGRISIATRGDDGWAEIRISDTGGGIPDEIGEHIFDPFFTTKEVGKGTGQGLSICRDVVVKKHGGRIFFETVPGKGTAFVVRLPVNGQDATSAAA
jgi:PAS domain S-box-containing protein